MSGLDKLKKDYDRLNEAYFEAADRRDWLCCEIIADEMKELYKEIQEKDE